jgi:hypothetical protein
MIKYHKKNSSQFFDWLSTIFMINIENFDNLISSSWIWRQDRFSEMFRIFLCVCWMRSTTRWKRFTNSQKIRRFWSIKQNYHLKTRIQIQRKRHSKRKIYSKINSNWENVSSKEMNLMNQSLHIWWKIHRHSNIRMILRTNRTLILILMIQLIQTTTTLCRRFC